MPFLPASSFFLPQANDDSPKLFNPKLCQLPQLNKTTLTQQTPKMAPGKWDDHSEKIMLFAMVTLLKAGKSTSWDNVETMMGGEFKANAIR